MIIISLHHLKHHQQNPSQTLSLLSYLTQTDSSPRLLDPPNPLLPPPPPTPILSTSSPIHPFPPAPLPSTPLPRHTCALPFPSLPFPLSPPPSPPLLRNVMNGNHWKIPSTGSSAENWKGEEEEERQGGKGPESGFGMG